MITDVILDDFLVSLINQGISGVRNNDLSAITTTIDFLDTQISNVNSILEDEYLIQNDTVSFGQTRIREIYFNFRALFNVYRKYLQDTNGVIPYSSWVYTNNTSTPFNSASPAAYMSTLQPVWYVGRDDDGDGIVDSIVPEVNASNQVQNWASSPTSSAGLYRILRSSVDPGSGTSGRTLRRPGNLRGRSRTARIRESGGTIYTDSGESSPGGFYDEYYLDYLDSPSGGDGRGGDFSGGGDIFDPSGGNITGGGQDFTNLGGGRPTEDAIRRERLRQEYIRTRGRILTTGGVFDPTGTQVGTPGTRLGADGIPIVPLGFNFGTPLSNAISIAPNGVNTYGAPAGVTDTQMIQNMSAAPLSMNGQPLSISGAPAGAITSFSTSIPPQPRDVTVSGGCQYPKYSFKVRQVTDRATKRFYGFNIKGNPKLVITMYASCLGSAPVELFTTDVPSYTYFQLSPNSKGDFSIETINSLRDAVGKIQYGYHYDIKDIISKIYQNVQVTRLIFSAGFQTVLENINRQISRVPNGLGERCFVDNFGPQMGSTPGRFMQSSFYDNTAVETGFIVGLPQTVKDYQVGPSSWYTDTIMTPAMGIIENFFFMASTEYGSLNTGDVTLDSVIRQLFQQTDRLDTSVTSLINSRVSGELELSASPGTVPGPGPGPNPTPSGPNVFNRGIKNHRFYGSFDVSFTPAKSNDCSAPYLETGGFLWSLEKDDQVAGSQKIYAEEIRHLITETDSSVGQITGPITGILRGDRNNPQFQLLLRNGLTSFRNSTSTTVESIPENSCLEGLREQWQWGIKRQRVIPWKIFCNTSAGQRIEIDYRTKPGSEVDKWVLSFLLTGNFSVATAPSGELLRDINGYYYSVVDETAPIEGDPTSPYFTRYSGIQRIQNNPACPSVKRIESSWRVDVDNPCGCDEIEIITHYISYPAVTYIDPLYGTTETFPALEIKDQEYPAPAPESRAAAFGLTEGQELTNNRREKPDCFEATGEGRLHHPFLYGTDILPGVRKKSIKGLFNLSQSLDCYYTSSIQNSTQKEYYYEVTDCDNCKKTAYFAVAYGHYKGSGSISSGYEVNDSPSRAIYSQYRLLTLDPHEKYFTFYDGGETNTPDDIYVINYYRNGLSDKLDIGNFEINIAELSGSNFTNNVHTGSNVSVSSSNKVLSLIDNSSIFDSDDVCANEDPNYYYDVVSGSLANGIHASGAGTIQTNEDITTYGKVYPNLGIIVLDGHKLNVSASFNSVTGSNINGDNSFKLFTAISGAAAVNKPMRARNVKFKTTNHYFVRIPSGEANHSNNPTYVRDVGTEKGRIKNMCFVDNPMTYITTIGLYNSKKDLIAIAKLSKPIKKTKENDVLVKIRLNW
jgi:hypothetical protein